MERRASLSAIILIILLLQSCKKSEDNAVTDAAGNVYSKEIVIGTQIWMAENLKTTRFSNGDSIGTTSRDISGDIAPEYQWAYNGDESKVEVYGRLYTWYAAADSRNICPDGWHVPTDEDWTTLTDYLGGEDMAGGKLKEAGIDHWLTPNAEATNESKFNALPAGCRFSTGLFSYLGNRIFWWSSTEHSTSQAYSRTVSSLFGFVNRDGTDKLYGFSVRCLKNN